MPVDPSLSAGLGILGCGLALLLVHRFAHPRLRLMRELLDVLLAGCALAWQLELPVAATMTAIVASMVLALPHLVHRRSRAGNRQRDAR